MGTCAFTQTNVKSLLSLEYYLSEARGNTNTSTLCMTRRLSQSTTVLTIWASHRHQRPPGNWPHQHHQQGKQDPGSIEKNPKNRLLFSKRQVLQGIRQTSTGICKLSLGPKQHQADQLPRVCTVKSSMILIDTAVVLQDIQC